MKLILKSKDDDYLFKYIDDNSIYNTYKTNMNEKSIIFRICRKFQTPMLRKYFSQWKKNIKDCDQVIIFDSAYCRQVTKLIKKENKNAKIILYYWNKIENLPIMDKNIDDIYTFNLEDSQKFNIYFNPQFYTKNIKIQDTESYTYDVTFIGCAKERKENIIKIEDVLKNKNIKTNIKIIDKKEDYIKYENYLDEIANSKAILEIAKENAGLTLRTMESIFLNKKLITNYKNIERYDFYNSNNIFILGKDDINEIDNFLKSKYEVINLNILKKYEYENWKSNFKL